MERSLYIMSMFLTAEPAAYHNRWSRHFASESILFCEMLSGVEFSWSDVIFSDTWRTLDEAGSTDKKNYA